MSLLSICTQAANYAGVTPPSAIFGNSNQTALLLLASANLAGQSISRRPEGGWVSTIREYDFTTASSSTYSGTIANVASLGTITIVAGVDKADLDQIVVGTWIASGTGVPNNAVITAIAVDTNTYTYTFTFNQLATQTGAGQFDFGQSDYILPADFQRPIDNTFWDRTRFWSMRGPQSPQQWQLYKSSVIGKASIQRRYRFRYIQGQSRLSIDPTPFDNGASLVFEYVSNGWCESTTGTPQTSWQADTDIGVIDEYLIELETIWRVLRRLGLSYSEEMAEAERQIDKALATDGAAAILDMTPNDQLTLIGPWNLPETNFGNVLGTP